jgi:hypothetical protein
MATIHEMCNEIEILDATDKLERVMAAFPEVAMTPLKARTLLVIFGYDGPVIDQVMSDIGLEGDIRLAQ